MKKIFFPIFTVAILLSGFFVVVPQALAATKTWNKTTGGAWTTAGNWTGGVPVAGDDVIINSDQSGNITAVPTITLNSLTVSGSATLSAASSGNTITISTTFSVAAGKTLTMGPSGSRMNFTLSSTAQGTVNGTVTMDSGTGSTYTFTNNGTLIMAPDGVLGGDVVFNTVSGSTLQIGSTAGITSSGTTGNIRVTGTRTFNTGANYTYNGTSAQVTGNGLPSTVNNLTINNSAGVTLSGNNTVSNTLTLTSGTFAVGAYTLTLNGPAIAGTLSNLSTTSSSNLSFGGSSTGIGIPSSVTALNTLTINNVNNVILNSNITLTTLTLTSGKLKITVNAIGIDKIYDGGMTATATLSSYKIVSNNLTYNYSGSFADKNVGTGKIVTVSGISLGGTNSGNYILSSTTTTTTASITAKHITGGFTTPANKVYDGNNLATVTGRSLTGVVSGDTVSLTGGTATFINKNVANGKAVTLTGASLAGADKDNYILDPIGTASVNITAKHITGNFTANNKVYDGNNTASVATRTLNDTIGGDDISLVGGTATFSDANVAVGKTVTLTGASLAGTALLSGTIV